MQTSISSVVPLGATQVYSGRCLRGEKTYFAQISENTKVLVVLIKKQEMFALIGTFGKLSPAQQFEL